MILPNVATIRDLSLFRKGQKNKEVHNRDRKALYADDLLRMFLERMDANKWYAHRGSILIHVGGANHGIACVSIPVTIQKLELPDFHSLHFGFTNYYNITRFYGGLSNDKWKFGIVLSCDPSRYLHKKTTDYSDMIETSLEFLHRQARTYCQKMELYKSVPIDVNLVYWSFIEMAHQGILPWRYTQRIYKQWINPKKDFRERNMWNLLCAFSLMTNQTMHTDILQKKFKFHEILRGKATAIA